MASDEKPSAQQNEAVLFVQTVLQTIDAHGSSLQMVLGATLVVSLGAFGSLVRPPSAAPPKERRLLDRRKRRKTGGKTSTLSEGLLPSDALLFPVMAGTVLVALYYAIQYLRDPDLLGKIVRAYAALMSMLSLSRLAADVFELATQLVFPTYWRGGDGRVFVVLWERRVVGEQQTVWLRSEKEGDAKESYVVVRQVSGRRGTTPLPGILGSIPLPQRVVGALWKVRLLLREDWDVEFKLLGGVVDVDTSFRVKDVVGKVAAAAAAVWYYWTESVIVSNLMGVSFCYGAMLTVSPTTFITAVCVLCGLFVYDVVMVFYTPFMVGVATKIDAPIKLVFKAKGKTGSILGLGDIVVPGILIGFMLRFDHYMYYKQKIYQVKHVPKDIASSDSSRHDASTEAMTIPRKVPYIDVTDHWGDYLWTRRWGRLLRTTKDARTTAAENPYASCPAFPKPYFIASLAGYALGMAATVAVVMLTGHGQPALLYLVPAVSVVPVLTALARGQFKELLEYTEDGSLDTETVVVPVEGDEKGGGLEVREKHQVEEDKQADKKAGVEMVGRVGGKSHNSGNGIVDANNGKRADSVEGSPRLLDSGGRKPRARKRVPRLRDGGFEVFRLSITAPGDPVRLASIE